MTKQNHLKARKLSGSVQEIKVEQDIDVKSQLGASSTFPNLEKRQKISQEQINQCIDYVVNHSMSVHKVSFKVKTRYPTERYYCSAYKNDSKKKIHVPLQELTSGKINLCPGTNNKTNEICC
jgi:hypothetical protein